MDCIFCKIVAGEIPSYKIYEDDKILVFLDISPVNPGHALVVPKEHYEDLLVLPDELALAAIQAVKKVAPAILKATGATGFNLNQNNGTVAGQAVSHFHWHIVPRLENDGRELWHGEIYSNGQAEELIEKIKQTL